MNKHFLTFKNQDIEDLYQTTCIGKVRMQMFSFLILCLVISFLVRIVQAALQKNFLNVFMYSVMLAYFIIQYFIAKRYPKLLRISFILVNHIFSIFFLIVEESSEPNSSYLRGANQMGSNFLCVLSGEYLDAIFSLFSIQIIRVIMVIARSKNIEYFALFSAGMVMIYASIQFHRYHKALRSQFLLTLKEKQWDNVLNQIIKEIPYLLLSFNEDDLKFTSILARNCEKIIESEEKIIKFLRESTSQGKSLEFIIFKEIKNFQKKHQETFNNQIYINFNKTLLLIEYSIFYGNQPTILIIFKDFQVNGVHSEFKIQQEKQQIYFLNYIIKFCSSLQNSINKNTILKITKRKIFIQKLQKQFMTSKLIIKKISINRLLSKLQMLYKQIRINSLINEHVEVFTSLEVLNLLLFSILESLETNNLNIFCIILDNSIEFRFFGYFNEDHAISTISSFESQHQFIIQNLTIQRELVFFQLLKQAFIPFKI